MSPQGGYFPRFLRVARRGLGIVAEKDKVPGTGAGKVHGAEKEAVK